LTALRGAQAPTIGRRAWKIAGAFLFVVLAIIVGVSYVSAARDNARIGRLKSHGTTVTVTVTGCTGNIGGSGSNAAGYTCRGTYLVDGTRYHETIGKKVTLSPTGATVRGVADPSRPSTVELASAVKSSSASTTVYVVPSLLALVLVALGAVLLRRRPLRNS
jgi:hypothetical protein